jgi:HTH-type transcriptional regulator / antitoxin HipB
MVKTSDLRTAADVRAKDMHDLAYRREYERTRLASDIAIKVLQYRQANRLSQTELAARLGMRQPNIARLEAGEHAPSLETLSRLADVLKLDFSVEVKPGRMRLRRPAQRTSEAGSSLASHKEPAEGSAPSRRGTRVVAAAASARSSKLTGRNPVNTVGQKVDSPRSKAK